MLDKGLDPYAGCDNDLSVFMFDVGSRFVWCGGVVSRSSVGMNKGYVEV